MSTPTPNPGSTAAIEAGCRCPVMDNHRGHGYMGQPGVFVMAGNCELHKELLYGNKEKK